MTYPPQDPGTAGGDPYMQSQPGAQPPAGGYAPGSVGPAYPTSQQPAYGQQPYDPTQAYAQPGYGQQSPGYAPQYGQYGPPPVQPQKSGGGTAVLVVVVVLLMAVGGVAGFFLLGGDREEGNLGASDDTSQSQESTPDDGGETGEDEPPAPSGTHLTVNSLGAVTPIPGPEWQYASGPGAMYGPMVDAEVYQIQHTEWWISFFGTGVYSGAAAVYDPADLNASAESAAAVWLDGAFDSVEGYVQGEITYQEVEVDGRPGVLAEWRNSWTSAGEYSPDLYEDTAMLIVDVDGVNAFLGIASISESAATSYQPAVDALLATVFDTETA